MRKHLTLAENFALATLVQKSFVTSKMNDKEFAKLATKELGFEVTFHQVFSHRNAFNIPAHGRLNADRNMDLAELQYKITEIFSRLKKLEDRVEIYLKGSRGDSK